MQAAVPVLHLVRIGARQPIATCSIEGYLYLQLWYFKITTIISSDFVTRLSSDHQLYWNACLIQPASTVMLMVIWEKMKERLLAW